MSVYKPGFPGGSVVKKLPADAGDVGLIPGSGRSPGEGNGNLLQYPCLGSLMDRGAWQAACSPWGRRVRLDLATEQHHPDKRESLLNSKISR